MDTVTHEVNELATPDRVAIEHLLGKALESDQRVVIVTYTPSEADSSVRAAAKARIETALARAASYAATSEATSSEADQAIAEAMEAIRPRLHP